MNTLPPSVAPPLDVMTSAPIDSSPESKPTGTWRVRLDRRDLLVVVLAALYLGPVVRVLMGFLDEGIFLHGAQRILDGELLYRDFCEIQTPGTYYLLAFFFWALGSRFAVARGLLLVLGVLQVWAVDRLSRRLSPGPFDWVPAGATLVLGIPLYRAYTNHWDSTLFAVLTCTALAAWVDRPARTGLFLAGFWAALTAETMQSKGVAIFAAALGTVLFHRAGPRTSWQEAGKDVLALAAGPVLLALLTLWFFWRHGALADLIEHTVVYPLSTYSKVFAVPFGYGFREQWLPSWDAFFQSCFPPMLAAFFLANLLIVALLLTVGPFLALAGAGVTILTGAPGRRIPEGPFLAILACAAALWLSELHRPDSVHLAFGGCLFFVVELDVLHRLMRVFPRAGKVLGGILALSIGLTGLWYALPGLGPLTVQETRRGPVWLLQPEPVIDHLSRATPAGENVFVYPWRPMLYFLGGIRNPTRYSVFLYHETARQTLAEILTSLEEKMVPQVIVDMAGLQQMSEWYPAYRWPPPAERAIERYLAKKYVNAGAKGEFLVFRRRPPHEP